MQLWADMAPIKALCCCALSDNIAATNPSNVSASTLPQAVAHSASSIDEPVAAVPLAPVAHPEALLCQRFRAHSSATTAALVLTDVGEARSAVLSSPVDKPRAACLCWGDLPQCRNDVPCALST